MTASAGGGRGHHVPGSRRRSSIGPSTVAQWAGAPLPPGLAEDHLAGRLGANRFEKKQGFPRRRGRGVSLHPSWRRQLCGRRLEYDVSSVVFPRFGGSSAALGSGEYQKRVRRALQAMQRHRQRLIEGHMHYCKREREISGETGRWRQRESQGGERGRCQDVHTCIHVAPVPRLASPAPVGVLLGFGTRHCASGALWSPRTGRPCFKLYGAPPSVSHTPVLLVCCPFPPYFHRRCVDLWRHSNHRGHPCAHAGGSTRWASPPPCATGLHRCPHP